MNRGFAICLMLSLAMTWSAAEAQPSASSTGTEVQLVVTVETPHGANLPVIHSEDVMVYEGRDRDKVTGWVPAEGDHAQLQLYILIDDGLNASFGSQLEDIRSFILAQPATAMVGLAYMQNGVGRIEQSLTSNHAVVAKALRLPLGSPGINASPYFSLSDLIKHWPQASARREVVMISDGIDRYWGSGPDDPYVNAVCEQAQRAGVIVFPIYSPGAGHDGHSFWRIWWGQINLSRVSDETGGESYYIGFQGAPVSFSPFLDDVALRLSHQYRLSFLAKPEQKAGMQRIRLMTEVPNAELVGANSVYVGASP